MSERGFFGELLHRRVFQYLGLYIAGVWLSIEMGDWLSEQFAMPERLTTYIFAFMAVLLPSVALFAWNHGAPGKDRATKTEFVFVPLNILLAATAVVLVPERAPEQRPAEVVAEAPAPALPSSQRVVAYFLANNTSDAPDWYAYALPQLIAADLQRESPAFFVFTPFANESLLAAMRQAGFDSAMRLPQALQLQLAQRRRLNFFLRGELADGADGRLTMRYALHDAVTGEPRISGEADFDDADLFAMVDRVSGEVRAELEARLNDEVRATDLPASETLSPNLEAMRLYTLARIAMELDRDAPRSAELLEQAVGADPQFAEAHGALGNFHYLDGDNARAVAAFDEALRFGFRLSRASEFLFKVNKAAIAGDVGAALDTARAWTRVEPGNEKAYRILGELNMRSGQDIDEAVRALETVRTLNPMASETLKWSALLERQRGNADVALALLEEYTAASPDDAEGLVSLAQLQSAEGEYDAALATYRQAEILDGRGVGPQLGAVNVLMRRGAHAQAEDRLTRLMDRELTDQQRLEVLSTAMSLHTQLGQYRASIEIMNELEPIMLRVAGPAMTRLQVQAARISVEGYLTTDPAPTLSELEALRATMQPPWSSYISIYVAGLLSAHDLPDEFLEALPVIEQLAASQPANGNLQFISDTYRAIGAIYEGNSESAVELIRGALERSRTSFLAVIISAELLAMQADMYDVLRRAGQVGEAVTGLEAIVTTYPGLALAHLRLAQAYFELGKTGQAREALATVKSIWSDADPSLIYMREVEDLEAALDTRA